MPHNTYEKLRAYRTRPDVKARTLALQRKWYAKNKLRYMLYAAKSRAIRDGIEFNITADDVGDLPEICPLLGIKLVYKRKPGKGGYQKGGPKYDSPSIDRIDPNKGYIKGNVWIVSWFANSIKRDATFQQLKTLVTNLEKKIEGQTN